MTKKGHLEIFAWKKSKFFANLPEKIEIFPWKNRNVSEICLENSIFFYPDPQLPDFKPDWHRWFSGSRFNDVTLRFPSIWENTTSGGSPVTLKMIIMYFSVPNFFGRRKWFMLYLWTFDVSDGCGVDETGVYETIPCCKLKLDRLKRLDLWKYWM